MMEDDKDEKNEEIGMIFLSMTSPKNIIADQFR
jgi:hypothetical protein